MVKSSTQWSKQRSTRLENIYSGGRQHWQDRKTPSVCVAAQIGGRNKTDPHELLHLLALHALLEFALLLGIETETEGTVSLFVIGAIESWCSYPSILLAGCDKTSNY